MIGSVFRLVNIDRDQDGLLIVRIKLCSLNGHHVQFLFHQMKKKLTNDERDFLSFDDILNDMGKWDDAQKYY
jgi:hypothetical protein